MAKTDQSGDSEIIDRTAPMHLCMQVNTALLPLFFQLLGSGFMVNVSKKCNLKELLCDQLGIPAEYVENRIQTLFLNAKVVDDVDACIVEEGSTLALSGALPGLVGATMRRGGFYASFRSQISHDETISPLPHQESGKITLKLFNLVVKDIGPVFLEKGILIKWEKLYKFILRHFEQLNPACKKCSLDGNSIDLKNMLDADNQDELVFLQVDTE